MLFVSLAMCMLRLCEEASWLASKIKRELVRYRFEVDTSESDFLTILYAYATVSNQFSLTFVMILEATYPKRSPNPTQH